MRHKGQIFNNSHRTYANVWRSDGRDKDSIRLSRPKRLWPTNFLSLLNLHLGRHFNAAADDDDDGLVVKYFDISLFRFFHPPCFFSSYFAGAHTGEVSPSKCWQRFLALLYLFWQPPYRAVILSECRRVFCVHFMKFECCLNFSLYVSCFWLTPEGCWLVKRDLCMSILPPYLHIYTLIRNPAKYKRRFKE